MEYNMPPNEDDKERVTPQGPRMLPPDWRSAPPFWDNFVGVLKRYTEFKGRASRKEYWLFQLMYFIIMWAVSFVGEMIDGEMMGETVRLIIGLAILLPSIGVLVRRLHDTDRSGWWALLGLIPLANIVLLIFTVLPTKPYDNTYGPVPTYDEMTKEHRYRY